MIHVIILLHLHLDLSFADGNDKSDGGMVAGECPNRAESSPMNDTKKSLVLMNYFPTNPNATESCLDNSTPLTNMLDTCHKLSGNRWANFIAVDFYKVF